MSALLQKNVGIARLVKEIESGKVGLLRKGLFFDSKLNPNELSAIIDALHRGANIDTPQSSPKDCSILVVDNSAAYVYIGGKYHLVEQSIEEGREVFYFGPNHWKVTPSPNTIIVRNGDFYRDMIIKSLKKEGYAAAEAPKGLQQARYMLDSQHYDLALVGCEVTPGKRLKITAQDATKALLEHILKNCPRTEVVIMPPREEIAPYPAFITDAKAQEYMLPILEKPFSEQSLLGYLRVMLDIKPIGGK